MKMTAAGIVAMTILLTACAASPRVKEGQSVRLLEPQDGAVVTSPFKVRFGVAGMEVKPAGTEGDDIGHHHLLINHGSVGAGETVPYDETHIHFGKGQTEETITLKPGNYKLTAQFADSFHRSYGQPMSQTIHITVK